MIDYKYWNALEYTQDNLRRNNTGSRNGVGTITDSIEQSYVPGVIFFCCSVNSQQTLMDFVLFQKQ